MASWFRSSVSRHVAEAVVNKDQVYEQLKPLGEAAQAFFRERDQMREEITRLQRDLEAQKELTKIYGSQLQELIRRVNTQVQGTSKELLKGIQSPLKGDFYRIICDLLRDIQSLQRQVSGSQPSVREILSLMVESELPAIHRYLDSAVQQSKDAIELYRNAELSFNPSPREAWDRVFDFVSTQEQASIPFVQVVKAKAKALRTLKSIETLSLKQALAHNQVIKSQMVKMLWESETLVISEIAHGRINCTEDVQELMKLRIELIQAPLTVETARKLAEIHDDYESLRQEAISKPWTGQNPPEFAWWRLIDSAVKLSAVSLEELQELVELLNDKKRKKVVEGIQHQALSRQQQISPDNTEASFDFLTGILEKLSDWEDLKREYIEILHIPQASYLKQFKSVSHEFIDFLMIFTAFGNNPLNELLTISSELDGEEPNITDSLRSEALKIKNNVIQKLETLKSKFNECLERLQQACNHLATSQDPRTKTTGEKCIKTLENSKSATELIEKFSIISETVNSFVSLQVEEEKDPREAIEKEVNSVLSVALSLLEEANKSSMLTAGRPNLDTSSIKAGNPLEVLVEQLRFLGTALNDIRAGLKSKSTEDARFLRKLKQVLSLSCSNAEDLAKGSLNESQTREEVEKTQAKMGKAGVGDLVDMLEKMEQLVTQQVDKRFSEEEKTEVREGIDTPHQEASRLHPTPSYVDTQRFTHILQLLGHEEASKRISEDSQLFFEIVEQELTDVQRHLKSLDPSVESEKTPLGKRVGLLTHHHPSSPDLAAEDLKELRILLGKLVAIDPSVPLSGVGVKLVEETQRLCTFLGQSSDRTELFSTLFPKVQSLSQELKTTSHQLNTLRKQLSGSVQYIGGDLIEDEQGESSIITRLQKLYSDIAQMLGVPKSGIKEALGKLLDEHREVEAWMNEVRRTIAEHLFFCRESQGVDWSDLQAAVCVEKEEFFFNQLSSLTQSEEEPVCLLKLLYEARRRIRQELIECQEARTKLTSTSQKSTVQTGGTESVHVEKTTTSTVSKSEKGEASHSTVRSTQVSTTMTIGSESPSSKSVTSSLDSASKPPEEVKSDPSSAQS